MADVSSWLPNLIGPIDLQADGGSVVPRRATINWQGFTVTDNPSLGRTDIATAPNGAGLAATVGVAGSGASYICDGTADEVQINAAIAAVNLLGGGVVRLLAGTFTIAAPITLLSNVILEGAGAGVSKIVAVAGYSNTYKWMIVAAGTLTTGTAMSLTADAAFGDQSVTITASSETAAIAAGDHVFLRATRNADPIVTSNRYVGEFVKVLSVVGNTVNVYNTLRGSYATADSARAYRISFVENCGLRDVEVYQADALGTRTNNASILSLILTKNASVERCTLRKNDGPGIYIGQSIGAHVFDCSIRDLYNISPAFGYGVLIGGASEGFVIDGNSFENTRHAVDGGPHTGEPTGVNTYGIPRGGVISNNTANRILAAAYTTHSDAQGWLWVGNTASNCIGHGFYIRGRGMQLHGNTVVHCTAGIQVGDTALYGSGGSGAGSAVIGNTIRYMKALASTAAYTAAGVGVSAANGDGIILGLTDNVTVSGNVIEYCDGAGISLKIGACRNIIRNNAILNANLLGTASTSARSSAITFDTSYRVTNATITMAGTTATVTTGASINGIMVGRPVIIHDSVNPANDGTFTVVSVDDTVNTYTLVGSQVTLGATSGVNKFTFVNAAGVNEAGTIQFVAEASTDNIVEGNIARNTTSSYDTNCTGRAKYLVCDNGVNATYTSSSLHHGSIRNVIRNNVGIGMETGLLNVSDNNKCAGNASTEGTPVKTKAGTIADSDFQATPEAGTVAFDTTKNRLQVRGTSDWQVIGGYNIALSADFTTTSTTATATNLTFPVKAGEVWQFEAKLTTQCSTANGTKFAIDGPATSTLSSVWLEGNTTTVTSVSRSLLQVLGTLNGTAQDTSVNTKAPKKIWGTFTAGADGTFVLKGAVAVDGTLTILAGSSLRARKVTLV